MMLLESGRKFMEYRRRLPAASFDLGFITNPKNGEVKALSVSVP